MSTLQAQPLSAIRPERIAWLWEPYLPRGKLVLLDGDPGVGKSLLTIDLAARLSRGVDLPIGQTIGRPHTTLLLNAEDDAADTTRPRAEAAGADLERVIAVTGTGCSPFQFPAAIPDLALLTKQHRPDLIVIDPITAFISPEVAVNSDQSVRHVLSKLANLAEKVDCTILMVRHLRKAGTTQAIHRGLGSIGFIASVRAGLLAARHPSDPSVGVLSIAKANLTGPAPALRYRIATTGEKQAVVEWLGPATVSADTLAQLPTAPLRTRDRAAAWLHEQLVGGPRKATEMREAAAEAGIPEITLNRAKADLGVRSYRSERKDRTEWYWFDPSAVWPADAPCKRPRDLLPPLDPL